MNTCLMCANKIQDNIRCSYNWCQDSSMLHGLSREDGWANKCSDFKLDVQHSIETKKPTESISLNRRLIEAIKKVSGD